MRDKHATAKDAQSLIKSNLEEVNALQTLSDSLLILAKAQGTKPVLNVEDLSLKTAAESAIDKVSPLAKQKHVLIKPNLQEVKLQGDKQEITRLMVIFLDNAIKYSEENQEISIKTYLEANYAKLVIKDHGMGIVEKDLPHIFDRFYRADKSRSQSSGYGLGLSIARQIIQEHYGAVNVESRVSKGTTFTVSLPIKHSRNIL